MKTSKIKSIQPIKSEDRYDLEIKDNNNLYCNSILVHNCRCIADKGGLWSRQGKPIVSCGHIITALAPLFQKDPTLVLDGELYADKFKDNFNEIISLVRREDTTAEEAAKCVEHIKYHVYDTVCIKGKTDLKFSKRTKAIEALNLTQHDYLIPVDTDNPLNIEELDKFYAYYIRNGYEGQIVRTDLPYEKSRSKSLLKRKTFMDEEFTILDILEGDGNRSEMAGTIVYQLDDNLPEDYPKSDKNTFRSGIAGGEEFYIKLLKQKKKYIKGKGTVCFFGYTPAGKPRFPVTKAVFKKERDL